MASPEQLSENIADVKEPQLTEGGFEIARTPELESVVDQANELAGKIERNENVIGEDVLKLEEALGQMKFDVGGETMSIEEIRKIPNFKEQMEINKQIIAGKMDNHPLLTFLTKQAAESLSRHQGYLDLRRLSSLSDSAAESLSRHQGEYLDLCRLSSLSDSAVESLSRYQGERLYLGLSSLSDPAAESLSRHQGVLYLSGLSSLSDSAAESLSHHQGELNLLGDFGGRVDEFRTKKYHVKSRTN